MFKIELDKNKQFKKDWNKLNKDLNNKRKIKRFLLLLSNNPFSTFLKIKKLEPKKYNKFRLKVDNYRIIYTIDFDKSIIIVHRIWLRKEVYK